MNFPLRLRFTAACVLAAAPIAAQQPVAPAAPAADPRLAALKKELVADIDGRAKFTQEMVDQIYSFGELGFQEFETSKYLVGVLRTRVVSSTRPR